MKKKERNYAPFYTMLKKLEGAEKEQLVSEFTGGRTVSLREMTDTEYRQMLASLSAQIQSREHQRSARSSALKQMQVYGINTADWTAVDTFCKQARIAGKRFAQLSIPELVTLTRKLRAIIDKGGRHQASERASPQKPSSRTYYLPKKPLPS